jgi:major intracellular serine protease
MSQLLKFIPDLDISLSKIVSILTEESNWGLNFIDVQSAWKHTKGSNVKIAVIDTGWWPHKDLVGNFVQGFDATGNNDINDHGNFHSCHVCGIIAAKSEDQSFGVTGVAPESKLISIKALDDSGSGSYDYIISALKIAKDLDVDVINMSLGTPVQPDNDGLHNIIKEVAELGKIIICAAGNDGGEVNYPAKFDEVIAVAATDSSGQLARFSSKGPELDTAAPGTDIYSTWGNNQYIKLSGTSMACPMIAGIVSLIVSFFKSQNRSDQINCKNILRILQEMGNKDGSQIIQTNEYTIGVPKFCNYDWTND